MEAVDRPTFESGLHKRLYEYVERHGTAKRHMLRQVEEVGPEEFKAALDRLKTKGYLEEEGGTLRVALEVGSVEEYETDDVSFTIRPARQRDFDGLIDTIRDVTDEETYVVAESIAEQVLYEDTVSRHNTVESRVFFVATVDETVVGWTHLDLPHLSQVQETARLTVGVREDYRGRGIGSHLLRRGLDWARANGYRKVYNSAPAINDHALAFLDSHGWNTEAIRRDHYKIDDEFVDEVMMAYEF